MLANSSLILAAIDAVPEATVVADRAELKVIAANIAASNITGYSKAELLGMTLPMLTPSCGWPGYHVNLEEPIPGTDNEYKVQAPLLRKDMQEFPACICFRPFSHEGSEYLLGTIKKLSCREREFQQYFQSNQTNLMDLVAAAPVSITIYRGPEHVIEATNPFNLNRSGKKNIIGKTARQAYPEVEGQGFFEVLDHVYQSGQTIHNSESLITIVSSDGIAKDLYTDFIYMPYVDETGEVAGIFSFGVDVTEQVEARKKIEASEKRFRTIVETAQEGIWAIDEHSITSLVNEKMTEIMGYSAEEMIGRPLFDFMDEQGKATALPLIVNRQKLTNANLDFTFYSKKGRPIWTNMSANPIYGDNGEYKGALAMITDISERRAAEQKLLRSTERFRSLIENNEDVIRLLDAEWNIIYESPSGERLMGYSPEERYQTGPLNLIHPEDKVAANETVRLVQQNPGVRYPWKHRKRHKDGHYIWIEGTITNKLHDESVQAIVVNFRDITERKKAEEVLLDKNKQLKSLSDHLQNIREKERAEVAREVHDELGQQLTVLKMQASWIEKRLQSEESVVKQRARELLQAIDGTITTVRRISTDLRPSILDDFGLAEALEWHATEFQKKTGILCKVDTWLSEEVADKQIALTLFRVFQESLTNVVRHSGATEVQAVLSGDEKNLFFTIVDDGIGINEDAMGNMKTLGLIGMKERIGMLNGQYHIRRNGMNGTITEVTVPHYETIGNRTLIHA